jgi:hypothetical protein
MHPWNLSALWEGFRRTACLKRLTEATSARYKRSFPSYALNQQLPALPGAPEPLKRPWKQSARPPPSRRQAKSDRQATAASFAVFFVKTWPSCRSRERQCVACCRLRHSTDWAVERGIATRQGSSPHLVRSPSPMRIVNWPELMPDAGLITKSLPCSLLVRAKTSLARGHSFRSVSGIPIMSPNDSRWRIHK